MGGGGIGRSPAPSMGPPSTVVFPATQGRLSSMLDSSTVLEASAKLGEVPRLVGGVWNASAGDVWDSGVVSGRDLLLPRNDTGRNACAVGDRRIDYF